MRTFKYHIHREDIKEDEWSLLDPLPKHKTWTKMPYYCEHIVISSDAALIDTVNTPTNAIRIYNLPDFIQKLNEIRFMQLL